MKLSKLRLKFTCGMVLAASLALGACGSSSSESGADEASAPDTAAPAAVVSESDWAKQGVADAQDKVVLAPFKAGILHVLEVAESDQRCGFALVDALTHLGVSSQEVDGAGDPTKMALGMDTLLDAGVDVVFGISVEPGAITAQLQRAKEMGVKFINMCGGVRKNGLVEASVAPNDFSQAALSVEYIIQLMYEKNRDNPVGKVVLFEAPVLASLYQRARMLEVMLEEYPNIKIVARHEVDFGNAVEDIRKATLDIVGANPDIDAIYTLGDFMIPSVVSALKEMGKSIPIVSAQSGSPSVLSAIAAGDVAAVVDPRLDATSWIAVDVWLDLWAYKIPGNDLSWQKHQAFFEYKLITKDNVDPAYEMRPGYSIQKPVTDFVAYFKAKWDTQFK
jgi:ribose transport system substrate-binding protein